MEVTIVDRIRLVMEHMELTPSLFADEIGVQRSSVSHILSGRNKPSLDLVTRLLNRFPEINPVWMITGSGEMVQLSLFEESPPLPERKEAVKPAAKKVAAPMSRAPIVVEPLEDEIVVEAKAPELAPAEPASAEFGFASEGVAPSVEKSSGPRQVEEKIPTPAIPTPIAPTPAIPVQALAAMNGQKKIQKIIIFYDDKSFSVYDQEV